ncbi:1-deoxy-D-xylulose-5-phosphate reductoisomerase [Rhodospirillum centenum]|uniref:1-deoxy-D-xylulose 5-phosphate reductoisomerase n=1 Tax=Rhodospirillum centenum (strain ATCC 51521 / SW) TaxID=414684 RepID=DXR_RHOCS|nr:1-deoxy-D-xylulose-5-phosphate reductoisomerase [Rhodospirillum centenum]B6ISU5.1 RecName: Full=1-deoxy-D-xylulose 5-phosphate reductoisomerase; Short=DXP reductoisomerase; AltName: Full=1-deoxyxylulose-5-phosphate reductoisomerase; AltName: Full=2-C-methyl-D-erythritol 4-phosphate synthase [Rhodospirillum centenum SW]ACI98616.1 1-deoxy-D-xylulose 5-phosphate reductoisomerase [Rhodospirillum centenum SW]
MVVSVTPRHSTGGDGIRSVTVLGSTGSVGSNTVELIEAYPERYRTVALVARRNVAALAGQARRLRPEVAVVADEAHYADLKDALAGTGIAAAAGPAAVVEAAQRPADWVMAAIVGAAGLEPTLAAARRGAIVAFANKECLVCAGELLMAEVRRHGATLLPVDSEHSAIFQVFDPERRPAVSRLILTASGGPFRTWTRERMAAATPKEACAHPNWTMGAKISVDSASMMNKGLEIIEACHLFGMPDGQIDVLVHPQSVVHSMVEYVDGSVLAQLGTPDMRTPIAVALGWPDRIATPGARLDLIKSSRLEFEAPDPLRFPALRLARHALQCGGAAPTLLNAANEVAVQAFLEERIGFLDIERVVEATLASLPHSELNDLDDVRTADADARRFASEMVAAGRGSR